MADQSPSDKPPEPSADPAADAAAAPAPAPAESAAAAPVAETPATPTAEAPASDPAAVLNEADAQALLDSIEAGSASPAPDASPDAAPQAVASSEAAPATEATAPAATAPTASAPAASAQAATAEAATDQAAIEELFKQASFEDPAAGAAAPPGADAEPFNLPSFQQVMSDAQVSSIDLLRDVELNVKIELGRNRMLVEEVLKLAEGSVVELDKLAGDPVDVFVNERLVARGEVLVLNDNFCVRVNEIVPGAKDEAL